MSPRPQLLNDDQILAATERVIARLGPVRLTLADVASEAGMSPAGLVKRFGSKRGLLLSMVKWNITCIADGFARIRDKHPSPLDALFASFDALTSNLKTPESFVNGLAFLQIDIADRDFHRLALRHSQALIAEFRKLLRAAIAKGELASCDTARLARAVWATCNGSRLNWAIHREGPIEKWVRSDMETLLKPIRERSSSHGRSRTSTK